MHGMINRALQDFLTTTHGTEIWAEVASQAALPHAGFESMSIYDDTLTMLCFQGACQVLHQHPNALLEDIGIFLITHPPLAPLRRLLRFGGAGFVQFLHSLEELAERGRLALPDLDMPQIEVEQLDPSNFRLRAVWSLPGMGPILIGALRAMADEYGALVLMRLDGIEQGAECVRVVLLDTHFAAGRSFALGGVAP